MYVHHLRMDLPEGLYDVGWSEVNPNILIGAAADGSIILFDLSLPNVYRIQYQIMNPLGNWKDMEGSTWERGYFRRMEPCLQGFVYLVITGWLREAMGLQDPECDSKLYARTSASLRCL